MLKHQSSTQSKKPLLCEPKLILKTVNEPEVTSFTESDNNMDFPELEEPNTFQSSTPTFVYPNKRKLATNVTSYHKKYVLDSDLLCKENRFDTLSYYNYAMTENHDSELIHETETVVKDKIPPIILHDVNNYQAIDEDIGKTVVKEFTTVVKGNSLKINLTDITDFRKLTKFYEDSGIKFHTFKAAQDKKLEVVIRNVPTSLTEDEIKSELLHYNVPVCKVVRMLNNKKMVIPLCMVELENTDDAVEVF